MAEKIAQKSDLLKNPNPQRGENREREIGGSKGAGGNYKIETSRSNARRSKDDPTVETINMYDELLSNVKTPLTREEVGVLIDIFPEGGMYGVEWDLLKLVESYLIEAPSSEEYRKLITACPSEEWRETMQARLDNWKNNKQ